MIAELATDLITKIKTVSALQDRVGMASAGGPADPAMKTVPLPAAWLLFAGDQPRSGDPRGSRSEDIDFSFSLSVMVSYKDQSDLINTQLPTLEAIAKSVSGRDSTNSALRWKYQGAQLVEVFTDRLVYELSFSASGSYTI